jgi:hypothetical protein
MADPQAAPNPPPPPRVFAPLPAVLSYLVPGLGQIVQGRIAKGVLFFVSLYGLFFFGMYLGHWQNVYVPEATSTRGGIWRLIDGVTDRARFLGQAGIGVVAWPAILQYAAGSPYVELPDGKRLRVGSLRQPPADSQLWPETYIFVIGRKGESLQIVEKEHHKAEKEHRELPIHGLPFLGTFMGEPDEWSMNELLRDSDKKIELGWMYTVIAGVLNILVIYDALAGPAFAAGAAKGPAAPKPEEKEEPVAV